uniref:Uncharacterized protein n=1 Tax=Fagus sylvatica TaxID=28930 RepID=A0A2N9HBW7_FAGSY
MEGNEFNAGLQQRSPRGELAMEAEWRHGGMRSRPLARSGGGGFSDDGVKICFFFFFIAVGFVAGCGGFLMWVSVGFDFGLLGFDFGFWLTQGEVIDGFPSPLALGILVGAAALAAAAAALAAAQIS